MAPLGGGSSLDEESEGETDRFGEEEIIEELDSKPSGDPYASPVDAPGFVESLWDMSAVSGDDSSSFDSRGSNDWITRMESFKCVIRLPP